MKCEAALEEVAAQAQPYFVPSEKKSLPKPSVPAQTEIRVAPKKPEATKPRAKEVAPTPPPADDDFISRYADFDEASVAPPISVEDVPAPEKFRRSDDSEKIRAAEERVPAALRDYLSGQFQTRFSRLIPAEDVRIFSVHGEIATTESADAPDEPDDLPEENE